MAKKKKPTDDNIPSLHVEDLIERVKAAMVVPNGGEPIITKVTPDGPRGGRINSIQNNIQVGLDDGVEVEPAVLLLQHAFETGSDKAWKKVPKKYRAARRFVEPDTLVDAIRAILPETDQYLMTLPRRQPEGCLVGLVAVSCALEGDRATGKVEAISLNVEVESQLMAMLHDAESWMSFQERCSQWEGNPTGERVVLEGLRLSHHPFVPGLFQANWRCAINIAPIAEVADVPDRELAERIKADASAIGLLFQERIFGLLHQFNVQQRPDMDGRFDRRFDA